MKRLLLTSVLSCGVLMALASAPASADIIYSSNFESGSAPDFTLNGLWHITSNFPGTSNYALGYVQNETQPSSTPDGDYDTGAADPAAAFSPLIALPSATAITLALDAVNFNEIGGSPDFFDRLEIGVSTDGSSFASLLASTSHSDGAASFFAPQDVTGGYTSLTLDLSAFAGQSIYLMFNYDTVETGDNSNPGARINNIVVSTDVPEPASLALFGSAMFAIGMLRRRKTA
jgi:hypothetical protein